MSQQFKIQELELNLIVFDEELQVRLETDQETVQDYYEAMATEEDMKRFPPPTVYFDGCRYWLADGHHRYWAAYRRKYKKMTVKVINGSHDEALLAAVKLNAQNGLRFHDGDWEKIIPLIASKEQWKDWTNRRLAEELGCSAMTVQRYRSGDSVVTDVTTEKRRGRDGKMYKAKKARKAASGKKTDKPQETESETTPEETAQASHQETEPEAAKGSTKETSSSDQRRIEANVKRTQIHATISQLETQLAEWFEIAPDDMYEEFDQDVGSRIRALIH